MLFSRNTIPAMKIGIIFWRLHPSWFFWVSRRGFHLLFYIPTKMWSPQLDKPDAIEMSKDISLLTANFFERDGSLSRKASYNWANEHI